MMKSIFNRLTSGWNFAALFLAMPAFGFYLVARESGSPFWWGVFAVFGLVVVGLVLRFQWARWVGIALMTWLFLSKVSGLITKEFTWNRLIHAGAVAFIGYGLWRKPDNGIIDDITEGDGEEKTSGPGQDPKPMISLVQFRRQQRYMEAAVLAHALSEAWGLNMVVGEEDELDGSDGVVTGENPMFIVMVNKPSFAIFMVHNHDRSYFDEPDEVAAGVPNLRYAEIIREHQAWLAIDLMQAGASKLAEEEAYRMIGKAIAALADDDVMAILCPQHNFFNLWSAKLEEMLCGESPLDALREEIKAPVYGVPDGDVIERAITEARSRWPEFVTIFKNRQPDDERFIVKAPFMGEDGEVEHMWLQVFGLEPDYVHGHLMNDPMHTTKLKKGAQVEVAVAEISDWVCPDADDQPLGNFTHQAVTRAAKSKLSD
jgi:uncharacterized protein YegJ (DUF2314 family)